MSIRDRAHGRTWLLPAWGGSLWLGHDLDAIEALTAEREALGRQVSEADFFDPGREAAGGGVWGGVRAFSMMWPL